MPDFYYEDFVPGSTLAFGADRPVSKDEIIQFAQIYDPQPFHLDEAIARKSLLGGLSASGWHTACMVNRLNYDHWLGRTASMGAPGIAEIRWESPLRPGERLDVTRTVLNKRLSRSRPGMGLVDLAFDVRNQTGQTIMRQRHTQLVETRHPADPAEPAGNEHKPFAAPYVPAAIPGRPHGGWFEDLQIGESFEIGREIFTKDSILTFAGLYDPQRFHMDEKEAANSHFGALAASGWQTACLWMRNLVTTRTRALRELAAQGVKIAPGGPSPGFTHLRWSKPVFVGDELTYGMQMLDKRKTSKAGWGLAFHHNTGVNQKGETVFEFRGTSFIPLRDA